MTPLHTHILTARDRNGQELRTIQNQLQNETLSPAQERKYKKLKVEKEEFVTLKAIALANSGRTIYTTSINQIKSKCICHIHMVSRC